jgi:hypothetical protein
MLRRPFRAGRIRERNGFNGLQDFVLGAVTAKIEFFRIIGEPACMTEQLADGYVLPRRWCLREVFRQRIFEADFPSSTSIMTAVAVNCFPSTD